MLCADATSTVRWKYALSPVGPLAPSALSLSLVEGWRGDNYAFTFNIDDYNVITSDSVHLPPTVHLFMQATGVYVMNFLPKPAEGVPGTERTPWYHRNVDFDELRERLAARADLHLQRHLRGRHQCRGTGHPIFASSSPRCPAALWRRSSAGSGWCRRSPPAARSALPAC